MVRSLTRDLPEATIRSGLPAIALLVQKSTGIPCTILDPLPTGDLAERLAKDRLQLAIFQGVEFAWEHPKRPDLHPLVILVNHQRDRQALLVVRADSAATRWIDLKNGSLALPQRSREHCHLFLDRHCRENGDAPNGFFSRVITPATVEDALDDLVEGLVGAAVVDRIGLASYERRKPGRYEKLKVLLSSERFPDTVVAYRAGALNDATLQRFRQGLLQADKTLAGRHMLAFWMATAFEPPPADYDKLLADILKAYPAPDPATQK
jgi:ABC-type phosphate/phosphonate transport system substrate-binding protein